MEFPTTFSLFPQLPGEIRLKIWSFAISLSRTVMITCNRPPFQRGVVEPVLSFQADVPPPATLFACAESRHEALAIYKPYFRTFRTKDDHFRPTGRHIYVSFDQDTFRLEDTILVFLGELEIQGIQSMIVDVKDCGYFGHFNMDVVKMMKHLKKIDLWGDKGVTYSWKYVLSWQGHMSSEEIEVLSFHDAFSRTPDRWISQLIENFDEARENDPGWDCPNVRIFNKENNALVHEFEGGAAIPGWTNLEE